MCLEGFRPEVEACGVCGRPDVQEPMLALDGGMVHCRECGADSPGASLPLCGESLAALRHIADAPAKKEFSFGVSPEAEDRLFRAAEAYVRRQLDRGFSSLDYWKSVK